MLLHVETQRIRPNLPTDLFTVWNATEPDLKAVLRAKVGLAQAVRRQRDLLSGTQLRTATWISTSSNASRRSSNGVAGSITMTSPFCPVGVEWSGPTSGGETSYRGDAGGQIWKRQSPRSTSPTHDRSSA